MGLKEKFKEGRRRKISIKINSNFHHVAGEELLKKNSLRFKEYRRKWESWPNNFKAGVFPLFIDMEVTNACNLKCPFCATTFDGGKTKKGFIAFNLVKQIIDEGKDNNLYGVKFNLRGEPLLHPDIDKFVRYAKENNLIDVYFNTNGVLLDEDMAQRLIDAGLDRISISVEGYSKAVYEKYRVGSNFERIFRNINKLQDLKRSLGISRPKVRIQTVMLPEIKDSFTGYKEFWSKRADEVAYLDYKDMKVKNTGIRYPWACPQLWQRIAVLWDGTILPCNHDYGGLIALGNLRDTSIKKAWNSDLIKRLRDKHRKGLSDEFSACDGCYLRDSEIHNFIEMEKI